MCICVYAVIEQHSTSTRRHYSSSKYLHMIHKDSIEIPREAVRANKQSRQKKKKRKRKKFCVD